MRRYCLSALTLAIFVIGCGDRTPKTKLDLVIDGTGTKSIEDDKGGAIKIDIDPDPNTAKPVEVEAKLPEQEAYDAAVMKAVDFLAEGKRQEALDALVEAHPARWQNFAEHVGRHVHAGLLRRVLNRGLLRQPHAYLQLSILCRAVHAATILRSTLSVNTMY